MRRLPLLAALAFLLSAAPASAATFSGDFDNDGRADLAVGAPGESLGSRTAAGQVQVFYGRSGRTCRTTAPPVFPGTRIQTFTQDTPGVQGLARDRDRFGAALAAGDLNGDGFDDLVIGAPGDAGGAGTVTIVRGSATGLAAANNSLVRQGRSGVSGREEDGDEFGGAVRVDTGVRGRASLAIGAPGESLGRRVGAGAVTFSTAATGAPAPTVPLGSRLITQDTPGVPGRAETGDAFGSALSATGLGYSGLAVGAPGEAIGRALGAGHVTVLPRDANGLINPGQAPGVREVRQGPGGIPGGPESGDRLGAALLGNNGLHVGAPGEAIGTVARAGLVGVVPRTGVPQAITQNTPLVPGVPERGDAFGSALAATTNFLWVGAPGDSALLALNRRDGLNGASEPGAILAAQAAGEADLGATLTVGDFTCRAFNTGVGSEVAVGAPGEAGQVQVLFFGSTTDPTPRRVETISQGSPGVPGAPELGDLFGAGL